MPGYESRLIRPPSLNLMAKRLGLKYDIRIPTKPEYLPDDLPPNKNMQHLILDSDLTGIASQETLLASNGGFGQQDRMIFDKLRTLDRAVKYSYQGAFIKKLPIENMSEEESKLIPIYRALINPNKNKVDYDDKILSVRYEYGVKPGTIFEWLGTRTYWLIYLQDLTELAYFRGDIRRCSYEINWKDEDGNLHSTYAAVRGPVETKINFIQKHEISIDIPNHSLHIMIPRTEAALKYFRRYSKFYLKGEDKGSPEICWRVEATDWISTPGILEITAVEYYINKDEDDLENEIAGGLIVKPLTPNEDDAEAILEGETFIKPKKTYSYEYQGPVLSSNYNWSVDKKYPVELLPDKESRDRIRLKWKSPYSGQFDLSYGGITKTIVVESLF